MKRKKGGRAADNAELLARFEAVECLRCGRVLDTSRGIEQGGLWCSGCIIEARQRGHQQGQKRLADRTVYLGTDLTGYRSRLIVELARPMR